MMLTSLRSLLVEMTNNYLEIHGFEPDKWGIPTYTPVQRETSTYRAR